jgi:hypothetical protein
MAEKQEKLAKSTHGGARPGAGRKPGPSANFRAIQDMAKEYAEAAWQEMINMAYDDAVPANVRKDCLIHVLERAYGKPKQGVELSGPDGGPIEVKRHEQALALLA